MATRTATNGFTFVELMLVVVLIGILATTAIVAAGEQGESRLDLVEVQVRDALQHARSLSRSARSAHGVVFDVANEVFAVVDEDGTPVIDTLSRQAYVVDFDAPGQPAGVDLLTASFGSAGAAICIDADGYPLTGGTLTMACGKATRTLTLDQATGEFQAP